MNREPKDFENLKRNDFFSAVGAVWAQSGYMDDPIVKGTKAFETYGEAAAFLKNCVREKHFYRVLVGTPGDPEEMYHALRNNGYWIGSDILPTEAKKLAEGIILVKNQFA